MRRAATYVTLLTAGLAQPILQLYGTNNAVFTAARIEGPAVVLFAVAVLLVPPALLIALDVAVSRAPERVREGTRSALVAVSALPLCMVLLRGIDAPWAMVTASSLLLAVAAAVLHRRSGAVRTWLGYASPLAIAVLAVFVVSSQGVIVTAEAEMVEVSTSTTVPARDATPAERVSVVWLQLDEAPLWPLLRTDGTINADRFPGFAALAESSTWYRNMLGLSQTTVDAVPAMLTGTEPVTGRAPTYWNHRRNVFSLMYGRRSMDVHEMATSLCPREACATVSVSGSDDIAKAGTTTTVPGDAAVDQTATVQDARGADWGQFLRDTWVVLGHKLLPSGLRDRLPPIDEGWGGFGTQNEVIDPVDTEEGEPVDSTVPVSDTDDAQVTDETLVETKRNTVLSWQRGGSPTQVPVAQGMIERAARASVPTFHFAHVLLPHRPWQLTPDLRSTAAITTDKRSAEVEDRVRDEYQAFLAQYAATDRIVLDLVESLRRSANWDRTMIIVTADHGIAFEPGESKRRVIEPTNRNTLEQIYRVPLFVKWPDQTDGRTDDCPVQGFDVLPMVMAATGLDPGWEMAGTNPVKACPMRESRTVWWDKGKTTMNSGFDAAVQEARRLDRWVDADGDVDDIARAVGYEDWFDIAVPADAPIDDSLSSWTVNQKGAFANVGTAPLARTPMQFDGTFRARARVPAGSTGLVTVRGRVVAVVPEIAGVAAGTHRYRSILLPSAMPAGAMEPELWVARGSAAAPMLTRVGPPAG